MDRFPIGRPIFAWLALGACLAAAVAYLSQRSRSLNKPERNSQQQDTAAPRVPEPASSESRPRSLGSDSEVVYSPMAGSMAPNRPRTGSSNYELPALDLSPLALFTDVLSKWDRSMKNLPVHTDVPRLARNVQVTVNGAVRWTSVGDGEEVELLSPSVRRKMHSSTDPFLLGLLTVLASGLGEDALVVTMRERFDEFFEPEKSFVDVSRRLGQFLTEVVPDSSSIAGVLKTVNQSVLAPAVVRLKYAIGREFPYKDVRGGWQIFVEVQPTQVVVSHQKREQAFTQGSYRFLWELRLTFNSTATQLTGAALHVRELSFGPSDDAGVRSRLQGALKPFLDEKSVVSFRDETSPTSSPMPTRREHNIPLSSSPVSSSLSSIHALHGHSGLRLSSENSQGVDSPATT